MLKAELNELLTRTDPGTPLGGFFRRFWVPVLLAHELPEPDGTPVRVELMGEELVAFRDSEGKVGLIDAYCAHRGSPLFFGRNEACGLRCIYHGWKFNRHGECTDMPNEPADSEFKHKIKLKAYPTVESGGLVWAYLGPAEAAPEMPEFEWLALDKSHYDVWKYRAECNYLQAIEGDHDSSHISMLHGSLSGLIAEDGTVRDIMSRGQYWEDPAPRLFVLKTDYGFLTGSLREASQKRHYWRLSAWLLPWYNMIASDLGAYIHMNIVVPIDDNNCWIYKIHWLPDRQFTPKERYEARKFDCAPLLDGTFIPRENRGVDYLMDRERQRFGKYSGIDSLVAEDRAVTERMRPVSKERIGVTDRTLEHLASADASIIFLRRRLLDELSGLQNGKEPVSLRDPSVYLIRTPVLELASDVQLDMQAATAVQEDIWSLSAEEYCEKTKATM